MAYRRSTGSKFPRAQLRQKTSRLHGTADRCVAKMTTKSASGSSRRPADHAGGNGAKARGLRLFRIHAAENSDQQSRFTAEIEQDGGADGQVATETDARQPARFTAAGILAAAGRSRVRSRHWLSSRRATAYTRGRSKTRHTSWAKRCGRSSRWFTDQRLWFERDDLALIAAISTLLPS